MDQPESVNVGGTNMKRKPNQTEKLSVFYTVKPLI